MFRRGVKVYVTCVLNPEDLKDIQCLVDVKELVYKVVFTLGSVETVKKVMVMKDSLKETLKVGLQTAKIFTCYPISEVPGTVGSEVGRTKT